MSEHPGKTAMSEAIKRIRSFRPHRSAVHGFKEGDIEDIASYVSDLEARLEKAEAERAWQPKVKVKALIWEEARLSTFYERFTAVSILGQYEAMEWSDGTYGWTAPPAAPNEIGKEFNAETMEAAKAAAQADYEARILSALKDKT